MQGWLFGVNSFDQWGVQLGKVLAGRVAAALDDSDAAEELNSSTRDLLRRYRASQLAGADEDEPSGASAA